MKKSFSIDYNRSLLSLSIELDNNVKEEFLFDLKNGDIGDYWSAFNFDGIEYDINFYQEDDNDSPSMTIYGVVDGQIDTTNYEIVPLLTSIGNPKKYFI